MEVALHSVNLKEVMSPKKWRGLAVKDLRILSGFGGLNLRRMLRGGEC